MRLVVATVIAVAAGKAQAAPTVFTNTDEVRACAAWAEGRDHGFLVGTGGGLMKADRLGRTQQVWTMLDGLPATRIDTVERIGTSTWVGTEKGGAEIAVAGGALTVKNAFGASAVRDFDTLAGRTYAATEQGVMIAGSKTVLPMRGGHAKQRLNVRALAVVDGRLWAGTAAGLYRMDGATLVKAAFATDPEANDIASLYADGDTLWIASVGGLYSLAGSTSTAYGGGELRVVTKLDDAIVVAGVGSGVQVVDRGRLVAHPQLRELRMTQAIGGTSSVCAGGLDGLWVRTGSGDDVRWVHPPPRGGLPANDVSALAADGDALWVGMFDHGVARYANGQWMRIASERLDRRVNALLVDKTAAGTRVWVATATGVSTIDMTSATTYTVTELGKADGLPARGALSLAKMKDGRVLAGTMHGAVILGDGRPRPINIKQGLNVTNVWAVAEDTRGDIWLGTTTGVYRGSTDGRTWTRYAVATGELVDDWVMALAVDPASGAVFAGTYKGGVTRFDGASDEKPRVTQLGGGWINPSGLSWRDGGLLAATMEGLLAGDGATASWTTSVYASRDTTATAHVGGTSWVATRRGIVGR